MERNCNNCGFGGNNTKYESCARNPECPVCQKKVICVGQEYWIPILFKPSAMHLLALESLIAGREVYNKDGRRCIVISIHENLYHIDGQRVCAYVDEIYPDKPCIDLTEDDVRKHIFEKVWTWDHKYNLRDRILKGYKEGNAKPYVTIIDDYKHASLNKPNI